MTTDWKDTVKFCTQYKKLGLIINVRFSNKIEYLLKE